MYRSLKLAILFSAVASTAAFADNTTPAQTGARAAGTQVAQAAPAAGTAGGASTGAAGSVAGAAGAVAGGVAAAAPAIGIFAAAAAVGNASTRNETTVAH